MNPPKAEGRFVGVARPPATHRSFGGHQALMNGPGAHRAATTGGRHRAVRRPIAVPQLAQVVQSVTRLPLIATTSAVIVSTVIAGGTGYLYWGLVSRTYPAAPVGQATTQVAALSAVALVAAQALSASVLVRVPRAASGAGKRAVAGSALAVAGVASLALAAVVGAVWPLVLPETGLRSQLDLALFVLCAVSQAVGIVVDAAAVALRRSQIVAWRNITQAIGKLAVLYVLTRPQFEVDATTAVVASWGGVGTLVTLWAAAAVLRSPDRRGPTWAELRTGWRVVRTGIGAQNLAALGGALPTQLIPIVVTLQLGAAQGGFFSLTWMVGGVCFMVSPAVCQGLLAESNKTADAFRKRVRLAYLLIGLLVAAPSLIFVTAGDGILALFGDDVAIYGVGLLTVLVLSVLPDAITNVAVSELRVQEKIRSAAAVNCLIAALALLLTIVLLPHLGIAGAGWGWLGGQTAGALALVGLRIVATRDGGSRLRPLRKERRLASTAAS
jgi:O-antigen/teichoic acid export membrane protein